MSQKPDAANCFSRRVRQAVTPLNSEAFSYDARKLLHNSASVALQRGDELLPYPKFNDADVQAYVDLKLAAVGEKSYEEVINGTQS